MMKSAIFLGIAVVFNAIVNLLFKRASQADKGAAATIIIGAVLLVTVNALCYTKSLARIDLSVAYPIFAAGSIILICFASSWLYSETLSIRQAFGMGLIIGGMALVCAR